MIAAVCSDVWERPPEKVLGMRARFAEEQPEVVAALVRAVEAASRWAADTGNRADLAQLLSQPRYVGAPARMLLAALNGSICVVSGQDPIQRPDFASFGPDSIVPYERYAELFYSRMRRWNQVASEASGVGRARASFRTELFYNALKSGMARG